MCLSLCGVVVAISEIKNYETIVHVQCSSVRPVFFRSYDEVFRSAPYELFFLDRTMRFLDRRVLM